MRPNRLAAASARFLEWASVNLSPRTCSVYRLYLERFLAWAGDVPLSSLTPAKLTAWSRKYHPIQAVQRLTAWCHKEERTLEQNPLQGMRKIPTGKRLRVLSDAEQAALLRGTDRTFRPILVALRESIARPQEVRAFRAIDIRQAGGVAADVEHVRAGLAYFMLEHGKGFERRTDQGAVRIIPISPRLGRLLLRTLRAGARAGEPLFRDARGRRNRHRTAFAVHGRLRVTVGIGPDSRGENVVAYSMRHTGATAAARAGLRDFTLAAVLGHASTRTTARYVHLQAADVTDAMQRVWDQKQGRRSKIDRLGSLRTRSDDAR